VSRHQQRHRVVALTQEQASTLASAFRAAHFKARVFTDAPAEVVRHKQPPLSLGDAIGYELVAWGVGDLAHIRTETDGVPLVVRCKLWRVVATRPRPQKEAS